MSQNDLLVAKSLKTGSSVRRVTKTPAVRCKTCASSPRSSPRNSWAIGHGLNRLSLQTSILGLGSADIIFWLIRVGPLNRSIATPEVVARQWAGARARKR